MIKHIASSPQILCTTLKASIGSRHVMVCASTHYGEEEMLLHTCKRIAEKLLHFLMVIIPHHIDRGQDIATICTEYGMSSTLRSRETTHNSIPKHTRILFKLSYEGKTLLCLW